LLSGRPPCWGKKKKSSTGKIQLEKKTAREGGLVWGHQRSLEGARRKKSSTSPPYKMEEPFEGCRAEFRKKERGLSHLNWVRESLITWHHQTAFRVGEKRYWPDGCSHKGERKRILRPSRKAYAFY